MLLDTSAIVEIFQSPAESARFATIKAAIGDEGVYVSMVQLAEVADWARRNDLPPEERIAAVKEMARIIPLDERICRDAAKIKQGRRKAGHDDFGLIDGIILATARSVGQRVLTLDEDFSGEDDCIFVVVGVAKEEPKTRSRTSSRRRPPSRGH
jgi:predicted nucleic acid-binding protein